MLRSGQGAQRDRAAKRAWNVVVFSVGGVKLAAKTEEVGGVSPWTESIAVPSRTPYVQSMLKRENDVLPIYDLGAQLNASPQGDPLLCLVARHVDGLMAICIDAQVPSLQTVDTGDIRSSERDDLDTLGTFVTDGEDIAIVALNRLGRSERNSAGR
jgi:chemotaxis signal transduction protein